MMNSSALGYGPACSYAATSCADRESACCIPDMGKTILAVQWVTNRPIQQFTMHGFWPGDCATGMGPSEGCRIGATKTKKDVMADRDLSARMAKYWVSSRNNSQWFWDHEWNKHGTCLSTVRQECHVGREEGPPHIRYFKASLREYAKYDVYDELKRHGVVPRAEPYTQREILRGLRRWDSTFKLICTKGRLSQIYFHSLGVAGNAFIGRSYHGTHDCPQTIYYPPKDAYAT